MLVMPMTFLAAAISVDVSRVILTRVAVGSAAQNAALAGAHEFVPGQPTLRSGTASTTGFVEQCTPHTNAACEAVRLFHLAQSPQVNMVPYVDAAEVEATATEETVTVTVGYEVSTFPFASFFLDADQLFGTDGYPYEIERSATICVPGEVDGVTGGQCRRPGLGD